MSNEQDFLTIYTAAVLGGYTVLTIRNAIKTNKLPAEKIDGKFIIQRNDFNVWLESKGRSIKAVA
ncbi:MAG: hypothetical protein Q7T96_01635 [Methylobacter sp.]|nr:hypothetical protein [Methylobacter sp.]